MKKIILLQIFLISSTCYAGQEINCLFEKFHVVDHSSPDASGYTEIRQTIEINDLKTTSETLKLDGQDRATNSTTWLELKSDDWDTNSTTFAGNFGEILTIKHGIDEKTKGLDGWYSASLVDSDVVTTNTRLGKCLVK